MEGDAEGKLPVALTTELVRQTRDAEALRHDSFYTQLWASLTSTQRRALLAILRESGARLLHADRAKVRDAGHDDAARGRGAPAKADRPRGPGARDRPPPARGPVLRCMAAPCRTGVSHANALLAGAVPFHPPSPRDARHDAVQLPNFREE